MFLRNRVIRDAWSRSESAWELPAYMFGSITFDIISDLECFLVIKIWGGGGASDFPTIS